MKVTVSIMKEYPVPLSVHRVLHTCLEDLVPGDSAAKKLKPVALEAHFQLPRGVSEREVARLPAQLHVYPT